MKKLFAAVLASTLAASAFAADPAPAATPKKYADGLADVWPSVFAACEWPASPEVIGLRVTIPYSTVQETVTGVDLGLWGRCRDFEGVQLNVIRNDVKDTLAGFQAGLYNSANRADLGCVQAGLFNETQSFRGLQVGIVNKTGDGQGFQVGIFNCAETLYGYQVGIINVIRDAEIPFFPLVNIGF